MPSVEPPIPPALRAHLGRWVGYDFRPGVDDIHHGLPSLLLTVILAFDEPLDCGWADGSARGRYWTLTSGLHRRPALVHTHGYQHGIQLGLTPLGARTLLGLPAGALSGEIVEQTDVPLGLPAGFHAQLAEADWPMRFRLLGEHLQRRVMNLAGATLAPELSEAWRVLAERPDSRVQHLADHVGWSRRHLTARFTSEFGLSPKQAASISRFERAVPLVRQGRRLSDVAAISGYADQAHLNREWRALAGQTPTETRNDFPIVQDES